VAIAVLAIGLATSCGTGAPQERSEVVLSIGYAAPDEAGEAAGLDALVNQLTREALFRSGPDGRIEPVLAESWFVNDVEGTEVVVVLRQNAAFHDGAPVTADAVKASLDGVRTDPARIQNNPVLGDIETIETDGPHRLVISLSRPSAQLIPLGLSDRIEKPGPDDRPIAAGPFFVESRAEQETTLRANPQYHQGRPDIDIVRIRTYPTLRTAWAAMMRSEIDFLYDVPIGSREFVDADSNVEIFLRDSTYAYALVFNTRRPPFDDQRLRVALSHGVDRQAIVDRMFGDFASVSSGIHPSHWVYDGVELTYDYDPQKAVRQLTALGLHLPASADLESTDRIPSRLSFEVLVGIDYPDFEPMALLVQRQLRQVGVDMTINASPFADVATRIQGNEWDAVLLPVNSARNISRLYLYWHSSQRKFAVSGFTGADDSLELLRSSATEADLVASAREFQRDLFEGAPAIFLATEDDARAVSRRFAVPEEPRRDVLETLWRWRVADLASGQ